MSVQPIQAAGFALLILGGSLMGAGLIVCGLFKVGDAWPMPATGAVVAALGWKLVMG